MRITEDHVDIWQRQGYVIVEDFLDANELEAVVDEVHRYLPTPDDLARLPSRVKEDRRHRQAEWEHEFPFAGQALNDVALHHDLLAFVEEILGTPDLALTNCLLWGRYPGFYGDVDQALHSDYANQSMVYPRDHAVYRQIPMILYYSDVTEETAPTYVVSTEHTSDHHFVPNWHSRDEYPELYEFEVPVLVKAGSLLIYSMSTFHRGSAFRGKHGARYAHGIVYQAAQHRWMGNRLSWAQSASEPEWQAFLEGASLRQRDVVGFPAPGDPYWTGDSLEWVAARYPGLDVTPYLEAVALPSSPPRLDRH